MRSEKSATARVYEVVSIEHIPNVYKQSDDEFNLQVERKLNRLMNIDETVPAIFSFASITVPGCPTPNFDLYYV